MPLALSLSYKNKTIKFDVVGERPATMHIQIGCLQNKRVEKLHRLKSQPMFRKLPNGSLPSMAVLVTN